MTSRPGLSRRLGLLGLTATGICAMLGAAINVIPIMLQRSVPGIGPHVLSAYAFAALPAVLAALAYASLASAMPRAGGSYVYVSRSLSPYWGFVASFSQWFGLSIAIGVVSYVLIPFLRDIADALGWAGTAEALGTGPVRVGLALAFLWIFVVVNLRGLRAYQFTLIPMMFVMFLLGSVVIFAGFMFDHGDFSAALMAAEGRTVPPEPDAPFRIGPFLAASALLFSSFIGFDSIAQAGGEARRPARNLPLAIALAVVIVGTFYLLFAAAIYHAVPWSFVAQEAQLRDLTAPGLLGYLLPTGWTVAIVGSHFAGDFFLGVDILVTSMLVNFLLMSLSLLTLARRNPEQAARMQVLRRGGGRLVAGVAGIALLGVFLVVHIRKDLNADVGAWYFHSTWLWLGVMAIASALFFRGTARMRGRGTDLGEVFRDLPRR